MDDGRHDDDHGGGRAVARWESGRGCIAYAGRCDDGPSGGSPEQEAAGHGLTSGTRDGARVGNAGGTAARPGAWHRPPREAGAAGPPGPDP